MESFLSDVGGHTLFLDRLAALSAPKRFEAVTFLATAGDKGIRSGEIAKHLDIPQNSLSTQMFILRQARLVFPERRGREVYYVCDYDAVRQVCEYLAANCTERRMRLANKAES